MTISGTISQYFRDLWEDPERLARYFVYSQYVVYAMMVMGFLIMGYLLFFK